METTRWEANPPRPSEFGPFIGMVPTKTSDQRSDLLVQPTSSSPPTSMQSGLAPHRQPLGINTM